MWLCVCNGFLAPHTHTWCHVEYKHLIMPSQFHTPPHHTIHTSTQCTPPHNAPLLRSGTITVCLSMTLYIDHVTSYCTTMCAHGCQTSTDPCTHLPYSLHFHTHVHTTQSTLSTHTHIHTTVHTHIHSPHTHSTHSQILTNHCTLMMTTMSALSISRSDHTNTVTIVTAILL